MEKGKNGETKEPQEKGDDGTKRKWSKKGKFAFRRSETENNRKGKRKMIGRRKRIEVGIKSKVWK